MIGNKAVFSTPGSSGAVKLAMNKLILPEIGHVVGEFQKDLPIKKSNYVFKVTLFYYMV